MLVKALIDFGGQYAMFKGDVADLPESPVTDTLVESGYVEPVASDEPRPEETDVTEEPAELTGAEHNPEEPEAVITDLEKLTKEELISFAEERKIEIDRKAKKADMIEQIMTAADEE